MAKNRFLTRMVFPPLRAPPSTPAWVGGRALPALLRFLEQVFDGVDRHGSPNPPLEHVQISASENVLSLFVGNDQTAGVEHGKKIACGFLIASLGFALSDIPAREFALI